MAKAVRNRQDLKCAFRRIPTAMLDIGPGRKLGNHCGRENSLIQRREALETIGSLGFCPRVKCFHGVPQQLVKIGFC